MLLQVDLVLKDRGEGGKAIFCDDVAAGLLDLGKNFLVGFSFVIVDLDFSITQLAEDEVHSIR